MVNLKTKEDVDGIREAGKRLAEILKAVAAEVKPGVLTQELDSLAYSLIIKAGGRPAFLNYKPEGMDIPYPASLCTSVNDEVVHGIPGDRVLKEGDIVGLDLGIEYQGYFADTAVTVPVGKVNFQTAELIRFTRESLEKAVEAAVIGNTLGDIGFTVQSFVEQAGYSVVRDLCGHGVGFAIHEDPQVPNFGIRGNGQKLEPGMVIAIEPMVNLGKSRVYFEDNGYTCRTADHQLSAHFEHTVAITEAGPEVLTKS
ncbi:MAG: type I methionyl aminopeptidase [bacterium]